MSTHLERLPSAQFGDSTEGMGSEPDRRIFELARIGTKFSMENGGMDEARRKELHRGWGRLGQEVAGPESLGADSAGQSGEN